MILCPTCRKKVYEGSSSCPRCETQLNMLFKIEKLAGNKYKQGCLYLKKQDYKKAYIMFNAAYHLKADDRIKKGIIISLVGLGDNISAIKMALRIIQSKH